MSKINFFSKKNIKANIVSLWGIIVIIIILMSTGILWVRDATVNVGGYGQTDVYSANCLQYDDVFSEEEMAMCKVQAYNAENLSIQLDYYFETAVIAFALLIATLTIMHRLRVE